MSQKRGSRPISPWLSATAAPRLPWQHHPAGASQSSPYPALTFGHLIENHVDQDVGATPAGAVTVNRRREMRTQQAMLPPLPTCPQQRVPSRSRGPTGGGEGGQLERKRHRVGAGGVDALSRPALTAVWISYCACVDLFLSSLFLPSLVKDSANFVREKGKKELAGSVGADGPCIRSLQGAGCGQEGWVQASGGPTRPSAALRGASAPITSSSRLAVSLSPGGKSSSGRGL